MDSQEKEFEQYLGGAPREAVQQFPKPQDEKQSDELSEQELIGAIGGLNYGVAVAHSLKTEGVFSEETLAREKETAQMLGELSQQDTNTNTFRK